MNRLLLTLTAFATACSGFLTDGDYHFVHRAGADLPVWVRGNIDSGVFLFTIHGGPGHGGHGMALSDGFQQLEEDYAVVYWDQRASGLAQGNPSPDTFTVDDFVADTDAVLSMILQQYEVDDLFVLGHSWGGDLALATMLDGTHGDDVDGWILHAAAHDEAWAADRSREWMADKIEYLVANDIDADWWTEVAQWYADNPDLPPSNPAHWSFVSVTGGYYYDAAGYEQPPYIELAFASPYSMAHSQCEERALQLARALLDDFDVSDRLGEITAPTLVLSGEFDGSVTPEVGDVIYAELGTADVDKHRAIVPDVAHSVHDEAPEVFAELMVDFMELYR